MKETTQIWATLSVLIFFSWNSNEGISFTMQLPLRQQQRHHHHHQHHHQQPSQFSPQKKVALSQLYSSNYDGSDSSDANKWLSSNDSSSDSEQPDWQDLVKARQDGSLWSSFSSDEIENDSGDNTADNNSNNKKGGETGDDELDFGEEAWLDTIARISADEIDFINVEADRADKQRQMQEMEFSPESIAATLGVEVDDSKEIDPENEMFEKFKEETGKTGFGMYLDDDYDPETVESHTTVEIDEETNETIRAQMVYVDEHTCIGCTHCAGVRCTFCFVKYTVFIRSAICQQQNFGLIYIFYLLYPLSL